MEPKKRTMRLNLETTTTTSATTSVTNAQLKAMIDQGVTAALAARDADRNTNGDDSHILGAGVRRAERTAQTGNGDLGSEGEGRMFPEESDKIEKYVGGFLDMIHGSVVASKPKKIQDAVEIRECLKLKNNNNCGNQVGGGNAPAKVYVVGHVRTNPDSNVVTGMFLLNNRYASVLFDIGADRSFMSTAFSSQIDITPTSLDHYYDVKLAD
ncbi:hypothetical protein Tco_1240112, partial [Tanacetum coccineum]